MNDAANQNSLQPLDVSDLITRIAKLLPPPYHDDKFAHHIVVSKPYLDKMREFCQYKDPAPKSYVGSVMGLSLEVRSDLPDDVHGLIYNRQNQVIGRIPK